MNARSQTFELSVEGRQIEESVSALFHTLLLHRTLGKFQYKQEGSYSIGTVGIVDVDCDFIDLTFVRVGSDELDALLRKEINAFKDTMRNTDSNKAGQISLEFYQKKRTRWPFTSECIPWEVWTVKLDILQLNNEQERQICREKVGEMIAEKVMYLAENMNRHEYVPKNPNQSEVDLVFDTTLSDVQPYLFKISHQLTRPSQSTVGTTMKKFFKDTLAL